VAAFGRKPPSENIIKEKNAALCRDAAMPVTAETEAKAAAQRRRKEAGWKAADVR
jgi:hypothetical protein